MKTYVLAGVVLLACSGAAADPALTIYNQQFAVVREAVPLDLKVGVNQVAYSNVTAQLEPDSVVLRDPAGKVNLQILEQNYRADPISQARLLSLFEGKTIDFQVVRDGKVELVPGKVIRSGYVPGPMPGSPSAFRYDPYTGDPTGAPEEEPLIEVDGKLQFALPGLPLFPALPDDTILKPTLTWSIRSDVAGPVEAELAYVSSGLNWEAEYNVVSPEDSDTLDLVGWVTLRNSSGKEFRNARIKLMAGAVHRVGQAGEEYAGLREGALRTPQTVTEKPFDEYHLYTLHDPTTLHDSEVKQVEFLRAAGVHSRSIYEYDGAQLGDAARPDNPFGIRDPAYGTESSHRVQVIREISNSAANHLGVPLPAGKVRVYRRDADGQLEFVGEDGIDHTPQDEVLRIRTGDAFDVTGDRVRKDFQEDTAHRTADESFIITLRNHKPVAIELRVIEHMLRSPTWKVVEGSTPHQKVDAQKVEFRISVPANGEKVLTYKVRYTWGSGPGFTTVSTDIPGPGE